MDEARIIEGAKCKTVFHPRKDAHILLITITHNRHTHGFRMNLKYNNASDLDFKSETKKS